LPDYTGNVTATDNCTAVGDLIITQTPAAGTTISGATNSLTLTVQDEAGNYTDVSFNVEVVDNTSPTITCIANQEVDADETGTYTVQGTEFDPTETWDNCGVAILENDFNNSETLAGETLPEGITTIVWSAIDNAGNENNCSFNVSVDTYVGIDNFAENTIEIYPNPFSEHLIIDTKGYNEKISFKIYNSTGQVVYQGDLIDKSTLNTSDFSPGVYIIRFENNNAIEFNKIIKE
ncbi:MAG: T9SS type A sorting domain-containing protein, partial [Perlabentimonas sp.]